MEEDPDGYGEQTYWDDRYQMSEQGPLFEWYMSWNDLKDEILASFATGTHSVPESAVLMIGCGNSGMSDDMYNDGFENILSVDYSDTVIRQMRERFPYLKYEVADVRYMDEYACASFPFIIDKGTMDAILCGNDATANAFLMLKNMDRLMPVGGVAVFITYGEPESRQPFLSLISDWSVSHIAVGDSRYMYTCVKQQSDATS